MDARLLIDDLKKAQAQEGQKPGKKKHITQPLLENIRLRKYLLEAAQEASGYFQSSPFPEVLARAQAAHPQEAFTGPLKWGLLGSLPTYSQTALAHGGPGHKAFLKALEASYGSVELALFGLSGEDNHNSIVWTNNEGQEVTRKAFYVKQYLHKGYGDELLKYGTQDKPCSLNNVNVPPERSLYARFKQVAPEYLALFPSGLASQGPPGVTTQEDLKKWSLSSGLGGEKDLTLVWLDALGKPRGGLSRGHVVHRMRREKNYLKNLASEAKTPLASQGASKHLGLLRPGGSTPKVEVMTWLEENYRDLAQAVTNGEALAGVGKTNRSIKVALTWPGCKHEVRLTPEALTSRARHSGLTTCPQCGKDATYTDRDLNNALERFVSQELEDHKAYLPEALQQDLGKYSLARQWSFPGSSRAADSCLLREGKPLVAFEVDGVTHYHPVVRSTLALAEEAFAKQVQRDKLKALDFWKSGSCLVHVEWQAYASSYGQAQATITELVSLARLFLLKQASPGPLPSVPPFVVFGSPPPGLVAAAREAGQGLVLGESFMEVLRGQAMTLKEAALQDFLPGEAEKVQAMTGSLGGHLPPKTPSRQSSGEALPALASLAFTGPQLAPPELVPPKAGAAPRQGTEEAGPPCASEGLKWQVSRRSKRAALGEESKA